MTNTMQVLDADILDRVSGGAAVPDGAGYIPVAGAIGGAAGASSATTFTMAVGAAGGAGIAAAGVAGWAVGSAIYNAFDDQIQAAIEYVVN